MRNYRQCGHLLKADCIEHYMRWPREWDGKEGLVVLAEIFAHELSFSYIRPWRRVVSYNGEKIKSLQHLQDLWSASCDQITKSADESNGSIQDQSSNDREDRSHEHPEEQLAFVRLELENDDEI